MNSRTIKPQQKLHAYFRPNETTDPDDQSLLVSEARKKSVQGSTAQGVVIQRNEIMSAGQLNSNSNVRKGPIPAG
jgi:hypothetical protein